jgi:hypothetical protein
LGSEGGRSVGLNLGRNRRRYAALTAGRELSPSGRYAAALGDQAGALGFEALKRRHREGSVEGDAEVSV